MRTLLTISCGIHLAMALGCGNQAAPWGKVTGTVFLQGQPVNPSLVMFSNHEKGIEIVAETDRSGRFTMRTDRLGGLPVGRYKVTVTPKPPVSAPVQGMMFQKSARPMPETRIPKLDQAVETTRLSAVVKEGANDLRFDLQP